MHAEDLYIGLDWLVPVEDFREACRALLEGAGPCGPAVRSLAKRRLSETQLSRLARVINTLRDQGRSMAPLTPFKLGVIGNGTLDLIAPPLVASAARHGLDLQVVTVPYGSAVQEAMSPSSTLNQADCDAVLVALDYRGLPLRPGLTDASDALRSVSDAVSVIETIRQGVREASGARCIVQTLAPPPETLFGSLDRQAPGTMRRLIEAVNNEISASLDGSGDVLFDVAGLAQTVGLSHWHSPVQWNMAKLPFAGACLPLYADHVGRLLGAMRGKGGRCLILDLDNTLWGGIVGDDGVEGLVLGEGDPTGEAFISVQRMALALRERGIVLAVSSKNDEANARRPFREHPEMLLREDHIAVFRANWQDKASNIRAIAQELSLGLDAMVFLDDNPAERGLIRRELPEVMVPELPEDPALYARTLAAGGYFEAVAISEEDRKRADYYQTNTRRAQAKVAATDINDYLKSLAMEMTVQPFDAVGRSRIVQLINKSNQFNLTTRRYGEPEIELLEHDRSALTLQIRLSDIFGDNGMISVVICRPRGPEARNTEVWEIDTWLMSCRVLGRGVERMVLNEILHHARARGIKTLVGVYRPTERNGMVRDHYESLGFTRRLVAENGETEWVMAATAEIPEAPMRVVRQGFMSAAA
jgi:FkbH-like protein